MALVLQASHKLIKGDVDVIARVVQSELDHVWIWIGLKVLNQYRCELLVRGIHLMSSVGTMSVSVDATDLLALVSIT